MTDGAVEVDRTDIAELLGKMHHWATVRNQESSVCVSSAVEEEIMAGETLSLWSDLATH